MIIICLKFPSNCWEILGITRKIYRIVRLQQGFGSGTYEMQVHLSLAFYRFVVCGFAIACGLPKNKSTSLGPVSGWEHQNCSTI